MSSVEGCQQGTYAAHAEDPYGWFVEAVPPAPVSTTREVLAATCLPGATESRADLPDINARLSAWRVCLAATTRSRQGMENR